MRSDVIKILNYGHQRGLATTMSTNGTLITQSVAKQLKQTRISEVSVSLDGLEDFHNKFRGQNCFDRIIKGIKWLKKFNIYTIISTCVCPENLNSLAEMAKLIKRLKVDSWRLFPIIPTGRATKDLMLTPSQMLLVKNFVLHKKKTIPGMFLGESSGWCGQEDSQLKLVEWDGCRAGKEYCAVSVEGKLKACPILSDDYLEGSIRESSFSDLWQDKNTFKIFRNFDINKLKGKCGSCKMKGVCQGGCRAVTLGLTGNIDQEFPLCVYHL